MEEKLKNQEILKLKTRLQNRLDYYIAIVLWGLFFFSFLSTWAIGYPDPIQLIITTSIYLFFPLFATLGMVSDRILVGDLLKYSDHKNSIMIRRNHRNWRVSIEDYVRIILIIGLIFINLPWIAARLGFTSILFFQSVHVGEHHGWIGTYMILSVLLITKTERLYLDSIFKEISIFLLCFLTIWGCGLIIDDFMIDYLLNSSFPFVVWEESTGFYASLTIQIVIVTLLSFIIYYIGWRKYYKKII